MATPIKGASSSHTQIEIDWVALTSPNNGDSTILSYALYWDQGTATWTELVGESSSYTPTTYLLTSGITEGSTYEF